MTSHSRWKNQSLSINCASEKPFKPNVYSQVLYCNEAIVFKRSSGIFPLSGLTWDFRLMQSDLTGSETMQLNANIKGGVYGRVVNTSSLARRVVSLDKELYSTLSLYTQVYKWVPATYCYIGSNPAIDQHPVRGEQQYSQVLHANETGISYGRLRLWLVCAFTFYLMQI